MDEGLGLARNAATFFHFFLDRFRPGSLATWTTPPTEQREQAWLAPAGRVRFRLVIGRSDRSSLRSVSWPQPGGGWPLFAVAARSLPGRGTWNGAGPAEAT